MIQCVGMWGWQFWIAQILAQVTTPENVVLTLSGTQGFLVLIAGVLLAFAFQLC